MARLTRFPPAWDWAGLAVFIALLLPYAAWVAFAALLNAALWRLN